MVNEKQGGGEGTPTINSTYATYHSNDSWWVKQGNIVHFYVGLVIATATMPAYAVLASGFPKAKSVVRVSAPVGLGSTTTNQCFAISGTSLIVSDSGSVPAGTYFYVSGTYTAEE